MFLNPDDHTAELLRARGITTFAAASPDALRLAFRQAAEATFAEVKARLAAGETVGVETVLSTDKYCALVDQARAEGGRFFLIYVALRSPELACRRVRQRVERGGHDVPVEKIRDRWKRSLERLPWFARRAAKFWVYDNSDAAVEHAPVLLAEGAHGRCVRHHGVSPK